MGVVDYAAFDPIFWMHHTNCDRIFAMWQALNPNSYVTPQVNEAGNFATPQGTVETENSPLQPFWQAPGRFWTAAGVRDTRTFNYTYPELVKWSTLSPQQKSTRLRSDINAMYGRSAPIAQIVPELFNATSGQASVPVSSIVSQTPAAGAPPAQKPVSAVAAGAQPAQKPAPAAAPVHAQAQSPVAPSLGVAKPSTPAAPPASAHQAAVASAAQHVPAPVAHAASTAASTVAAGAQKVLAAAPAPVQKAAASVAAATGIGAGHAHSESVEITGVGSHAKIDDNRHYHEWIANITVEKYAAKKSLYVHIFLGDFTTDPSKWGEDPNLVGTHVIFANNMQFTGCERCRDAAEKHKLVTGTIPLTGALGDRLGAAKVAHLSADEVVPYLRRNLHWRMQDQDGTEIHRVDVPSLKVSVAHSEVTAPTSLAEFPTWGEASNQTAVTTGRVGGANEND